MSTSFQDVLLRVKESADIVAVVGQYVPLKRAGSRYVGVCPFHNDRHPSMNVNPRMGIYKCFACGAGGDVIKFVQEFEKIGFMEALKQVAARAGVAIPDNFAAGKKDDGDRTALVLQANQIALQVYTETLEKTPHYLKYLEERGLNRDTVRHFQIGCAPEQPDRIRQLAEAKKVPGKAFVEAGILGVAAGGRLYDRFGGRLVFPIFNLSGRVIAFGGRIAPGKEGPKYINTPESPLYHKGRVLYGFHSARQAVDQSGEAVIVEGYMDLVSLWQAGVKNAVAVCGTALTKEHAQTLTRFARKVFLFFDGDAAGRKAARKSLDALMSENVEVRIPALPASDDPDSFVRSHSLEDIQELFRNADDVPSFLVKSRGKTVEALTPEEKDSIMMEASSLFDHSIPQVREERLQQVRRLLGLAGMSLRTLKNKGTAPVDPGSRAPGLFVSGVKFAVRDEAVPEWQFLQLLLSHPDQCGGVAQTVNLDWFADERVRELVDYALALLAEERGLPLNELVDRLPDPLRDFLAAIEILEGEEPERIHRRLTDYRDALELRHLRRTLLNARSLAQSLDIQNRIKALDLRKTQGG